jgi:hypothetical protein
MPLRVPTSEDLVSILDRVLDKSIVMESWIEIGTPGAELWVADAHARIASSVVYDGYGEQGSWKDGRDVDRLFPFWRRDLWTK